MHVTIQFTTLPSFASLQENISIEVSVRPTRRNLVSHHSTKDVSTTLDMTYSNKT